MESCMPSLPGTTLTSLELASLSRVHTATVFPDHGRTQFHTHLHTQSDQRQMEGAGHVYRKGSGAH